MGNELCTNNYITDKDEPKNSIEYIDNYSRNIQCPNKTKFIINSNPLYSKERISIEFNRNITDSNNEHNDINYHNASYLPILSQYNRRYNTYISNYYSTMKGQELSNIINSKINNKEKIKYMYALNTIILLQKYVRKFLRKKREKNIMILNNIKEEETTLTLSCEEYNINQTFMGKNNQEKKTKYSEQKMKKFNDATITSNYQNNNILFYFLFNRQKTNYPDGFDIKYLSNGKEIKSIFKKGITNGYTLIKNEDYKEFIGESYDDKANGYGIFRFPYKGCIYEGEFNNNKQHGYGIEKWYNGSEFKGQFYSGKKNGIGLYTWQDGSMAFGNWVNNYLHGIGIYLHKKEWSYKGNFITNLMEGYGELRNNKTKYVYFGFFKNSKKNGFGAYKELYNKDNKIIAGFWENDILRGFAKIMFDDGKEIFCIFRKNKEIQTFDSNTFYNKLRKTNDKRYKYMFRKSYEDYSEIFRRMEEQ